nr:unnamed protein product [Trichobilharzia regenti]
MQLAVMRDMGNSKARAVYEANLPDNFRRPQTDSALETFIRAKYEQKRYIAHEYVPSKPDVDSLMKELQRLELGQKKRSSAVSLGPAIQQPVNKTHQPNKEPSLKTSEANSVNRTNNDFDLLGLDNASSSVDQNDLFDQLGSNQVNYSSQHQPSASGQQQSVSVPVDMGHQDGKPKVVPSSLTSDLLGLDFGSSSSEAEKLTAPAKDSSSSATKITKDSILALYQQSTPQSGNLGFMSYSGNIGQFPTPNVSGSQYFGCNTPTDQSMHNKGFGNLGDANIRQSDFSTNKFVSSGISTSAGGNKNAIVPPQFPPASSNFAVWPDNSSSFYSPAPQQPTQNVAPGNQFGSFVGVSAFNCNPNPCIGPQAQPWSTNQPSSNQTFGGYVSHPTNLVSNHEAYLSQVKSQLTSLHLGKSPVNP